MGLFSAAIGAFKIGFGIGDAIFGKKKRKKAAKKEAARTAEETAWNREQLKYRSPRQNIDSQVRGVREAADKYGFNPLTLLAYGQGGGSGTGGGFTSAAPSGQPAPLASLGLLSGDIAEVDDWVSGDSARRRQADQIQIDIGRLKLEEARRDVFGIGKQPSAFGRRAQTIPSGGSVFTKPRATLSKSSAPGKKPNWVTEGREKDVQPMANAAGVFEIENKITGGPITIPGDSEPWGIDELLTGVVIGAPQVFDNYVGGGKSIGERMKKKWTPDKKSIVGRVHSWWNQ